MVRQPNEAQALLDRAARCIGALLDKLRGESVSAELEPAARELLRELRVFLVARAS